MNFFSLKILKILCYGHMLLAISTVKKLLERITKNNCKKANQKKFRVEKLIKKRGMLNCMLNGKATIDVLIVGLIKKT